MASMEENPFIKTPTPVKRIPIRETLYWIFDWLDILFFVTPLVIFFWRGSVEIFLAIADPFWFWIMTIAGCSVQVS